MARNNTGAWKEPAVSDYKSRIIRITAEGIAYLRDQEQRGELRPREWAERDIKAGARG